MASETSDLQRMPRDGRTVSRRPRYSPPWWSSGVLTRRLEEFTPLSESDRTALAELSQQSISTVEAKRDLIREGDAPHSLFLILEGWACHYRELVDGRRQIVDFTVPGDLCDLNLFILDKMDHSISAITRLKVAKIGHEVFRTLVTTHPNITTALWWQELVSKSIHREWIVNVGRRSALERIAHLFCEMFLRLDSVGLTHGLSCDFPPTQADIADATGLTAVHVNRSIQELRLRGLVELNRKKLTIPDLTTLKAIAGFNPDYLHHDRLSGHSDGARTRPNERQMPSEASSPAAR